MSRAGARTLLQFKGHGNMQGIVSSTLVFPSPDHRSIYSIQCEGGVTSEMTLAGLEPAIPGSVGRCLIHWATRPSVGLAPIFHIKASPQVAVCRLCVRECVVDAFHLCEGPRGSMDDVSANTFTLQWFYDMMCAHCYIRFCRQANHIRHSLAG